MHKFIPIPEAMKIPDAKAAVDKKWEKLEKTDMAAYESQKPKKKCSLKRGLRAEQYILRR